VAISFLMSRDKELPPIFQKLNHFGVPTLGVICATFVPAFLVIAVSDVAGLADLYAVGVVGAIATNLGASATDKHLKLRGWERNLMRVTFAIMAAIELSLFWDKPAARLFSLAILTVGLIARGFMSERRQKRETAEAAAAAVARAGEVARRTVLFGTGHTASGQPLLAAVRGIGRTLDFAIEEARDTDRPLYLLFVREQPITTSEDRKRKWTDDEEAYKIFAYAAEKADGHTVLPCYAVSDSPADTIVDFAATIGASRLLVGAPQRNSIVNLLRGNMVRQVAENLPEDIHMLVYA
jgi:nucleotide-binding universal stress UspA family protein